MKNLDAVLVMGHSPNPNYETKPIAESVVPAVRRSKMLDYEMGKQIRPRDFEPNRSQVTKNVTKA